MRPQAGDPVGCIKAFALICVILLGFYFALGWIADHLL